MSGEEFKKAIQTHCQGKQFADMPGAFKAFVDVYFRTIDVDGTKKNQNQISSLAFTLLLLKVEFFLIVWSDWDFTCKFWKRFSKRGFYFKKYKNTNYITRTRI